MSGGDRTTSRVTLEQFKRVEMVIRMMSLPQFEGVFSLTDADALQAVLAAARVTP